MARKSKKASKSSKQSLSGGQWLMIDPARVRFQHSRIRPYFSGCGRTVQDTLDAIRNKELSPSDLPPIQVIVGPEDDEGPWYFSLNNRRLYVLKKCREEGLLEDNLIRVRVRQPRSGSEEERYTLENCAVEAKFIREKDPKHNEDETSSEGMQRNECKPAAGPRDDSDIEGNTYVSKSEARSREDESDEESVSESSDAGTTMNRFSALM